LIPSERKVEVMGLSHKLASHDQLCFRKGGDREVEEGCGGEGGCDFGRKAGRG
jgi:hypothetical protein